MTAFVASNDAGGAEALSDFLIARGINFDCFLTGPALGIFSRKFSNLTHSTLDKLHHYEQVITSTSAISDTEFITWVNCRKIGLKSTVIIDSGGNMGIRFLRNGVLLLPDELIVCSDEIASEIKSAFDYNLNIIVDNEFYMGGISVLESAIISNVGLYLTDPISEHASEYFGDVNYFGFNEFDALEGFLINLKKINPNLRKIMLRHHPVEAPYKYINIVNKYNLIVSDQKDLINDLRLVNDVYGCSNNAMYIAYLAGRRVTSVLPRKVAKFGIYDDKFLKFLY
jgi:hypothetical protein